MLLVGRYAVFEDVDLVVVVAFKRMIVSSTATTILLITLNKAVTHRYDEDDD
jgi:hypothetical protein